NPLMAAMMGGPCSALCSSRWPDHGNEHQPRPDLDWTAAGQHCPRGAVHHLDAGLCRIWTRYSWLTGHVLFLLYHPHQHRIGADLRSGNQPGTMARSVPAAAGTRDDGGQYGAGIAVRLFRPAASGGAERPGPDL